MFSLYYLWREMRAEKRRLFLTILALAWATASITCMLAIGEGLRISYGQAMAASGKNLLVVRGGATSTSYRGQQINQVIKLTWQDFKAIKDILKNGNMTPEYQFIANISFLPNNHYNSLTFTSTISAVDPTFFTLRNITVQPGGRLLNELDNQARRKVIVLGNERAKSLLGKNTNPLGQTVFIDDQAFQIIGVTQPKLQLWQYSIPDNYAAWIPRNTYVSLAKPPAIDYFIIFPDLPEHMLMLKQQLQTMIARRHQLDPDDKNILHFIDNLEIQQITKRIFTGLQRFLGIIGIVSLIVAGVGIANVMLITIQRATKEIGTRMALGARTQQILGYYLIETMLTTAIGGLIGITLAKGFVLLWGLIPFNSPFFKFIPKPDALLSGEIILLVILILSLVGFFSGLLPAIKATRIHPAEALRHE